MIRLQLLEGFALRRGDETVALPPVAQRLVAYLALRDRPVLRSLVGASLWWDASQDCAHASLRSTLWRLRRCAGDVVEVDGDDLRLCAAVSVDLREVVARARRLLGTDGRVNPADESPAGLRSDLLPGWCDDWVLAEREHLRQLQLHALEQLGRRLLAAGRVASALDVALSAVAAEPLRESTQRLVIAIHLHEGNRSEALRHHAAYRRLLGEELGVEPSPQMDALVADLRAPAMRSR